MVLAALTGISIVVETPLILARGLKLFLRQAYRRLMAESKHP